MKFLWKVAKNKVLRELHTQACSLQSIKQANSKNSLDFNKNQKLRELNLFVKRDDKNGRRIHGFQ